MIHFLIHQGLPLFSLFMDLGIAGVSSGLLMSQKKELPLRFQYDCGEALSPSERIYNVSATMLFPIHAVTSASAPAVKKD